MSTLGKIVFYWCVVMAAIVQANAQSSYELLGPKEFQETLDSKKEGVLVDVRTPEEYGKGHLPGAILMNYHDKNFNTIVSTLDTLKPVFVYCLSGGRSGDAVKIMQSKGFTYIYELKGGITKWRSFNFPEVAESKERTLGMSKIQYDSILASHPLVLIDFYATWCGPCKKMEPYLMKMQKDASQKVHVVRIDAEENQYMMRLLKIDGLPEILLYKKNQLVWSKSGYVSEEEMMTKLRLFGAE